MMYIFNKTYPLISSSFQGKLYKSIATGLFVILFLWLFDNKEQNSIWLFIDNGIVVFFSQLLFLFILHRLFAREFFTHGIRLWQYMAGLTGGIVLGFTLMYLYVTPVYFKTGYSFSSYVGYIQENLPFLFPVTLFILALDYIFILKNRLHWQTRHVVSEGNIIPQEFILKNESGVSIFKTNKTNILYIKSADNYIEIYYLSEGRVKKGLARYLLSAVEADAGNNFLTRVHRSYLCNMEKVESTSGGIQNCTLNFDTGQDSIPVARNRARDIIKIIDARLHKGSQLPH